MPIHDWTRVPAGIYHDFHRGWTVEIRRRLNRGVLPQIGGRRRFPAGCALFLAPGWYVNVPLEQTYLTSWDVTPPPIRELVETPAAAESPEA